jgi:hypothetical protein
MRRPPPSGAHRALGLVALAVLGGCVAGDGTRVDPLVRVATFDAAEIGGGRGGGPFPLEVRGTPPDGSDAEAVAAQMRTPVTLGNRPMAVAPPDTRGPRVVIAFAGSRQTGLCDGGTTAGAASGSGSGRMEAALAFCRGTETVTLTRMSSGATAGPKDDAFARAMRQAMAVLMPDADKPRGPGR